MSAEDCRRLVDAIEAGSTHENPHVSIRASRVAVSPDCVVQLVAALNGGDPITLNLRNVEYLGFFKDLAREGSNVTGVFEDIKFMFKRVRIRHAEPEAS